MLGRDAFTQAVISANKDLPWVPEPDNKDHVKMCLLILKDLSHPSVVTAAIVM